jgi:hypothetical protein
VALGVGIKTPSGRHDVSDQYYLAQGTTEFTVDQSIQPGDGGWGLILEGQGYVRVHRHMFAYASGSYLVSPQNQSDVLQAQAGAYSTVHVSIPDVFNARFGVSGDLWARRGIGVSAGARIDGIPVHDVLGGSDGFRRPALLAYFEPAISYTQGRHALILIVPVRVAVNFRPSLVDRRLGFAGGGDLARLLVFAGYQIRF